MCHLRHRLRTFLFHRKVTFHSRDIQFFFIFNHPMIYQICETMISIGTWGRVHIWIYLLNHNSLTHQTWSIERQGQYFSEIFWNIWRTGAKFQTLFNLATYSNYSITNYIKSPVFHFFERGNKGHSKMVHINYNKMTDLVKVSFH